jgi:integrase/recombinase XerD
MEISNDTTCLDCYFESFEKSLSSRNYKPATLNNYRCLLRRFGHLLDADGIAPSALTPDLALELGRRLPATPKSQVKVPNLARLFVTHLIDIGVATRSWLANAAAACPCARQRNLRRVRQRRWRKTMARCGQATP